MITGTHYYVPVALQYEWLEQVTYTSTITTGPQLLNAPAGIYQLTVRSEDPRCDFAFEDILRVADPPPFLTSIRRFCATAGLELRSVATSGGCEPLAHVWSTLDGALPVPSNTPSLAPVVERGTYSVDSVDAQGCMTTEREYVDPIRIENGREYLLDFTTTSPASWSVLSNTAEVNAVAANGPTFLVSDSNDAQSTSLYMEIDVSSVVETGYFGVALGFSASDPYLLLDWNRLTSIQGSTTSPPPRLRLSRVQSGASAADLWGHRSPAVTTLASASGGGDPQGPYQPTAYTVFVQFSDTAVTVFVDGVVQIEYSEPGPLLDGPIALYAYGAQGAQWTQVRAAPKTGISFELCDFRTVGVDVNVLDTVWCGTNPAGYEVTYDWGDGVVETMPLGFVAGAGFARATRTHVYAGTAEFFVLVCVVPVGYSLEASGDCETVRIELQGVSYRIISPAPNAVWDIYYEHEIKWDAGPDPPDHGVRIELHPPPGYGSPITIASYYPLGVNVNSFFYAPHHVYPWEYRIRLLSIPGNCVFLPDLTRVDMISSVAFTKRQGDDE